jgi:regulator of ribonuclease activity A
MTIQNNPNYYFSTPDLCDKYPDIIRILDPLFKNLGGKKYFYGEVITVKCFEDNSLVKEQAACDGKGKIMLVDGGGSLRKALLGDMIAESAMKNGWEGFVINGCIRDVDIISQMNLGVMALNVIPVKTEKRGVGDLNVSVAFAGQTIYPGNYLYADNNGIIISNKNLM